MLTGSAAILNMTRSASLIQICVDENKRALAVFSKKETFLLLFLIILSIQIHKNKFGAVFCTKS